MDLEKIATKLFEKYLSNEEWRVKENSNLNFSLQGLNNYLSSSLTANYWLTMYPPAARNYHKEGIFHIHNLGLLANYCSGWDLYDLIHTGFRGVSDKIASLPPKHFSTALLQLVNFLFTLQQENAGAVAVSNFDTFLAPFIKHDKLNYNEVKQFVQEFLYNMNIPTRIGGQTPFSNITLDLIPRPEYNIPVRINNIEYLPADCYNEMLMLNRALFEILLEGDAEGKPFTFPIPTINITEDLREYPLWDLILQITNKYGSFYFSNFINSSLSPADVRSMCCRLRLDLNELRNKGGGLFGANPLTGSIGVITINLARLALLANKDIEKFFNLLDDALLVAKKTLDRKRELLEFFMEKDLYPYSKFYLRGVKQKHGKYFAQHFSTIGVIAGHEACMNLLGKPIYDDTGKKFMLAVLDFIRDRLLKFQKDSGYLYNLEATPGEGISYRLAKIDKEIFGDKAYFIDPEIPFYTNSTQLPVNYNNNIFFTLSHQNELQKKYTGGTVIHFWIGEDFPSSVSLKNLIYKICEKSEIPYFTITPTFSICNDHGYFKGKIKNCPVCNKETLIYSRVVGYYRPIQVWNRGKQREFDYRLHYDITD